jgi:Endosomal/lysosomal potassium channel TMEM175
VTKVDLAHAKERMMAEEKITAHRLASFSDAVFAVIVTVMVLELSAPDEPEFSALWPLWPTAISYAVSYLFIAIIWINDHYLMRFVGAPTLRLIWINFVHLFLVSLLPFATAWVARTRLASSPVAFYAGLVHRHCLQRLRTRSTDPRGSSAGFRSHPAYREAPVTRCPRELHDRNAGCVRRASTRLRSDMRRPDPSRAARCPCQSAVMLLSGAFASQLSQTISPKSG